MPEKRPRINEAQKRALLTLANAPDPQEGFPIDWRIGTSLVQHGWAESGSRYALFRITEAGRLALSTAQIGFGR
jgi:hypothetical protein